MDQSDQRRAHAAQHRAAKRIAGTFWMVPEADANRVFDDPVKARRFAARRARQATLKSGATVVYRVVGIGRGEIKKQLVTITGKPERESAGLSAGLLSSREDARLLAQLRDQLVEMVSERNRFLSRLDEIEARIDARLAGGSQ